MPSFKRGMGKGLITRNLAIALAVALTLAVAPVWDTAGASGPQRIGELELRSIGTPHPYTADRRDGDQRQWLVSYPGATYIRVHFSEFNLAPGDSLRISDLSGLTSFVYTGQGPHDTGEFWGATIPGDSAFLTLEAPIGGGYGFEIDGYGRGVVPIFNDPVLDPQDPQDPLDPITSQPDSICGTNDWEDANCYAGGDPIREHARGSVRAVIGCCSGCTAFKVSDSGQFMTNNHCAETRGDVQATDLIFNDETAGCGTGARSNTGSVVGKRLLSTDYTLDYTLFTTSGDSGSIPCLQTTRDMPAQNDRIYIAGHPNGGPKKISNVSTHPSNPSGFCEADGVFVNGRGTNTDVGYYCDTIGGSSGSPVFRHDDNTVFAIHHFGGCQNSGVRMDLILDDIGGRIDTCGGGGSGGTCELAPKGAACSSDADCCSSKCRGTSGNKTCK